MKIFAVILSSTLVMALMSVSLVSNQILATEYYVAKTGKGELGTYFNKELSVLDFDLTGGIVVVNSGSFKTCQTKITAHQVGGDHFLYETTGVKSHFSFKQSGVSRHGYFLEGKLGLLDEEREWLYDVATLKPYLWAEQGVNPENLAVSGKVQSYAFNINRS